MALALFFSIIVLMLWLGNKGKQARRRDALKRQPASVQARADAEHRRRQQETDELITVILPTINNK